MFSMPSSAPLPSLHTHVHGVEQFGATGIATQRQVDGFQSVTSSFAFGTFFPETNQRTPPPAISSAFTAATSMAWPAAEGRAGPLITTVSEAGQHSGQQQQPWMHKSTCSSDSDTSPLTMLPTLLDSSNPVVTSGSRRNSVGTQDGYPSPAERGLLRSMGSGLTDSITLQHEVQRLQDELQQRDDTIRHLHTMFMQEKLQLLQDKQAVEIELESAKARMAAMSSFVRQKQADEQMELARNVSVTLAGLPSFDSTLLGELPRSVSAIQLSPTSSSRPSPTSGPTPTPPAMSAGLPVPLGPLMVGPGPFPTPSGPSDLGALHRAMSMPSLLPGGHRGRVAGANIGDGKWGRVPQAGGPRGATNCYHCHSQQHNWSKCSSLSEVPPHIRAGLIEEYKKMTDADKRNDRPRRPRVARNSLRLLV